MEKIFLKNATREFFEIKRSQREREKERDLESRMRDIYILYIYRKRFYPDQTVHGARRGRYTTVWISSSIDKIFIYNRVFTTEFCRAQGQGAQVFFCEERIKK